MPNWARHAIAHTKHISTCSGAPWHAVIEPHRTARVSSVRSIETLGEYMSAWRIEIRTGFYHRAKKTRPVKGLKLNPAEGGGGYC